MEFCFCTNAKEKPWSVPLLPVSSTKAETLFFFIFGFVFEVCLGFSFFHFLFHSSCFRFNVDDCGDNSGSLLGTCRLFLFIECFLGKITVSKYKPILTF